nr:dynamin-related protein 4C-like [Tanacetum cinerariifolium]
MIMDYIKQDHIIRNVLPATSYFTTYEIIMMSRAVDNNRKRTVVVVIKCDKDPDNVLAHVLIAHDIVSYKFVRNQMNYETYLHAQAEEAKLFATHPSLSNIANIMGMVGIPALADKLLDKLDDM